MILQTLLTSALLILVLTFIVVGGYLVIILTTLRETLKKTNAILENTNKISAAISDPILPLIGFTKAIIQAVNSVKSLKHRKE